MIYVPRVAQRFILGPPPPFPAPPPDTNLMSAGTKGSRQAVLQGQCQAYSPHPSPGGEEGRGFGGGAEVGMKIWLVYHISPLK
jgi:hypothetical protein